MDYKGQISVRHMCDDGELSKPRPSSGAASEVAADDVDESSRLTLASGSNDIYSFDPNAKVNLDDFVDIIGRNFKQPEEGLGFDSSPSAHMWRTLMWPTRYL